MLHLLTIRMIIPHDWKCRLKGTCATGYLHLHTNAHPDVTILHGCMQIAK